MSLIFIKFLIFIIAINTIKTLIFSREKLYLDKPSTMMM